MGPFGLHENAFIPSSGFLKEVLESHPMLRAVRVGAHGAANFLISLPKILPRVRMLWYDDLNLTTLDELVDIVKKDHRGAVLHSKNTDIDKVENYTKLIERMPRLQLLDIVATIRPRHLEAIFACFPDLVTLSLGTIYSEENTTFSNTATNSKGSSTITSYCRPSPLGANLRELHIVHRKCPVSTFDHKNTDIRFNTLTRLFLRSIQGGYRNLLHILGLLPSLQDLQIRKFSPSPSDNDGDEVPDYSRQVPFINIRRIQFGKEASVSPPNISEFVSLPPNLTEAVLGSAYSSTTAAIVHHCPYLEMLELTVSYFEGIDANLVLILSKCTRLKSLVAPLCQISYRQLVQRPLACKDLQVLECTISDIPTTPLLYHETMEYIRDHYHQPVFVPPYIGMPKWTLPDKNVFDKWLLLQRNASYAYMHMQEIMCIVHEKISSETSLDRVISMGLTGHEYQYRWTCSKKNLPKSRWLPPLKARARVISDSRVRWTGFSSLE